jgi:P-type conjugative transfer protein TrbG
LKKIKNKSVLKSLIYSTLGSILLIGCANNNASPHLLATTQVIKSPAPLVYIDQNAISKNFQLIYGNDQALATAFNRYRKTGKAPNVITDGFIRFAYSNLNQPIVNCEPFQETIITLQPGEKFTSITSGDPQNLSYMVAVSGSSTGTETQQVLVKPSIARMSTNLVIATDRRIYNIFIVVGVPKNKTTRNVAFWYPDEMIANINQNIVKQNDIDMNAEKMPQLNLLKANFDYKVSGDNPSWTPQRVFDDGKRTWIQMPPNTDNKNIPTVLIQSDSGQDMHYNQSYYSPYIIIDGIFKSAKLVAGVGSNQVEVDIKNKNY